MLLQTISNSQADTFEQTESTKLLPTLVSKLWVWLVVGLLMLVMLLLMLLLMRVMLILLGTAIVLRRIPRLLLLLLLRML